MIDTDETTKVKTDELSSKQNDISLNQMQDIIDVIENYEGPPDNIYESDVVNRVDQHDNQNENSF